LGEDLGGAIGDDPLKVVADIDVAGPPDLIEQLQDGIGRYAIGQADRDGDRLIVDGVYRQPVELVGLERGLKLVDFLDEGQLEVQSRPERLVDHHPAEQPLSRHLSWVDDHESVRNEGPEDANRNDDRQRPSTRNR